MIDANLSTHSNASFTTIQHWNTNLFVMFMSLLEDWLQLLNVGWLKI